MRRFQCNGPKTGYSRSAPNLPGGIDHKPSLRFWSSGVSSIPAIVLANPHWGLSGQPFEGNVPAGLVDAALELVLAFELGLLRRDKSEYRDPFSARWRNGSKPARSRKIVFDKNPSTLISPNTIAATGS